jgi:isopropylmalate/citramalate/homocitrate synthase-like protein
MAADAEIFVSDYNRSVLGGTRVAPRVRIFDTTLRDGEQTPSVALSVADKVKIATALDDLGVDIIEAGFPANSEGEVEAVRQIASAGLKAEVCALARANRADIDAALKCDVDSVHLFIATSDIHLKYKLRMEREQVRARAAEAIEYAKAQGFPVEWSCEDATRTELPFLKEMHSLVQAVGADRIDVPDTVGVMTPQAMDFLVRQLREVTRVPLAVHCHNDFGLAVANSLAAVAAGADQVHCTINGLGERAGNAALEEVVMGLVAFYGSSTGVDSKKLRYVSRLVSKLTGVAVQPNKAIVGENAFAHESGIHVHGILGHGSTYEPVTPELVGTERRLVVGKHTGTHSVARKLQEYGLELSKEQLQEVVRLVKKLAEGGKRVDDTELLAMAYDVVGRHPEAQNTIRIDEFTAITGLNFTPSATVSIYVDGERRRAAQTGVGPIDAALKAIRSAVSERIQLAEYKLEAITGGSDALCEVTVKVSEDRSPLVLGRSVGPDIVTTSVNATVEALNRLWWIKRKGHAQPYSSGSLEAEGPSADPSKTEGL